MGRLTMYETSNCVLALGNTEEDSWEVEGDLRNNEGFSTSFMV